MYKVILADDEPLILAGLRTRIDWAAEGYAVTALCTDGEQALEAVAKHRPALLLVDIRMPGLSGLEVIERLPKDRATEVIVISGFSDFSYAQAALRSGVLDYVLKPISTDALLKAVRSAREKLDKTARQPPGQLDTSRLRRLLRDACAQDAMEALGFAGAPAWLHCVAADFSAEPVADPLAAAGRNENTQVCRLLNQGTRQAWVVGSGTGALPGWVLPALESIGSTVAVSAPFRDYRGIFPRLDTTCHLLSSRFFDPSVRLVQEKQPDQGAMEVFLHALRGAAQGGKPCEAAHMLEGVGAMCLEEGYTLDDFAGLYNSLLYEASAGRGEASPALGVRRVTAQALEQQFADVNEAVRHLQQLFLSAGPQSNKALTSKQVVSRVQQYVQKHFAEPLSLKQLADMYYIDMSYLSAVFHSLVGQNFVSYLTAVRVRHAETLLKNTSLPLENIAAQCGFGSYSYFYKVYKKATGTTPMAYRKAHRRHEAGGKRG